MTLEEFLTAVGKVESDIWSYTTEAQALTAIALDPTNLAYVEPAAKTAAVYLAVVQADGLLLENVPALDQTSAICSAAIQQNVDALAFVATQTEALCLEAAGIDGKAIRHIRGTITGTVALEAVEQNGRALKYVPVEVQTEAICNAAVTENGRALEFVKITQTQSMCQTAVNESGPAIKWVDKSIFD